MKPNTTFILALIILLIDFYVFQGLKTIIQSSSIKTKNVVQTVYWCISAATIITLFAISFIPQLQDNRSFRNYVFAILLGIAWAKIIVAIFLLVDDVRRLFVWVYYKLQFNASNSLSNDNTISRSVFLSWLGFGLGGTLFGSLLVGFKNKYNYHLTKVKLSFPNLPKSFNGFKIIHISDIHSGSFQDKKAVQHGVDMIMQQQADMILFTGDLVNDRHDEMNDYIEVFNQLKAPYGVYSTLGNHDYGDYVRWESEAAKQHNLEQLKQVHQTMGWRLLMNEHVAITKNAETIALLGIENWSSKARFPKHGKLNEAYKGTENYPFKILLSHDPSHWDAEIKPLYNDIDLTLSGHTHGMQFGVETPFFRFSPVQFMYKQWAGLYEENKQKLYVNRGFGFLGYPGRVGILPEITVIELSC